MGKNLTGPPIHYVNEFIDAEDTFSLAVCIPDHHLSPLAISQQLLAVLAVQDHHRRTHLFTPGNKPTMYTNDSCEAALAGFFLGQLGLKSYLNFF